MRNGRSAAVEEPTQLVLFKKSINSKAIISSAKRLFDTISRYEEPEQIEIINTLRVLLHAHSPFASEPVDCVLWLPYDQVRANDYNPNSVAPPEMELLKTSILEDGYTQPIVAWKNGNEGVEVIDGFHRHRVGRECGEIRERVKGYLPVSVINASRTDRNDRIASTIRHNRARGKHRIEAMSDIVIELKNRNWTNERIARELGMDQDEILRLCQITGLAGLFSDQDFSKSWDVEDSEPDFVPITEEFDEEDEKFRTVNTSDAKRIFHPHDKWECYKAGFYATTKPGMTRTEAEEAYRDFLGDADSFSTALEHVIAEWKYSCEHYLTNSAMNRIAWLGQAGACYATGIPSTFRGGFNLLPAEKQKEANDVALQYLNEWLTSHGMDEVNMQQALSDNQMDLY